MTRTSQTKPRHRGAPGEAELLLRSRGLRVTLPRIAVLDALTRASHVDADWVAAAVRAELGSVSVQTIYDVLQTLTENGLIRRIEPAGSPMLYERRVGDNHHHIVCRMCHAIRDTECVVGEVPCLEAADPAGYVIEEAEVTFWGICPDCQNLYR
ncbi:MAG: transcriptional repressor [Propionibacteriaceae bacterium]|nr:transcriptional repressor [Propionibacteriaceae bacterium]